MATKPMNKILVIAILGLMLISSVSAYIFIREDDNEQVKMFKSNVNRLALEQEAKNGVTEEAFQIKYKYFIYPNR